jgi:predicted transcriptional regulator
MEIMRLIWSSGEFAALSEIMEKLSLSGEARSVKTIQTFLTRLVKKGYLRAEKDGHANRYIPLIGENEYRTLETREFLRTVHEGSVKNMIATLQSADNLGAEELRELRDWFLREDIK